MKRKCKWLRAVWLLISNTTFYFPFKSSWVKFLSLLLCFLETIIKKSLHVFTSETQGAEAIKFALGWTAHYETGIPQLDMSLKTCLSTFPSFSDRLVCSCIGCSCRTLSRPMWQDNVFLKTSHRCQTWEMSECIYQQQDGSQVHKGAWAGLDPFCQQSGTIKRSAPLPDHLMYHLKAMETSFRFHPLTRKFVWVVGPSHRWGHLTTNAQTTFSLVDWEVSVISEHCLFFSSSFFFSQKRYLFPHGVQSDIKVSGCEIRWVGPFVQHLFW